MNNQEIMEKFRANVGELNRSLKGWMVLWGTAIVTILISGNVREDAMDGALRWMLFGAAILILCMATRRYLAKYAKIYCVEEDPSDTAEITNVSFSDVMNCHAFDVATYYWILMRRLIPLMLISAVITALGLPLGLLEPAKAAIGTVAILTVPAVVIFLAWRYMAWSLSHAGALNALEIFMSAISTFVGIMVVGFAHVMIALKPVVMIEQHFLLRGMDESVPVAWGCNGGIFMMALVVIVVGLSLMVTDTIRMTVFAAWFKARKKIVAGLLIGLVLAAGALLFVMINKNVRITADTFTVREGMTEKVYGLDDVATYRVYDSMDTLAMEVTFSDGRKVSLFGSISEETKGWSEKYFSNYNYAAELMQKLMEKGIVGSMENQERLEKTVNGLDPKCQEGFRAMKEILGLK